MRAQSPDASIAAFVRDVNQLSICPTSNLNSTKVYASYTGPRHSQNSFFTAFTKEVSIMNASKSLSRSLAIRNSLFALYMLVALGGYGTNNAARAAVINFESRGIYRQDFGPLRDASGAILYRSTPQKMTGPAFSVPNNPLPDNLRGELLNDDSSPIMTKEGRTGKVEAYTFLSVAHGQNLVVIQTGQPVFGPAGSLSFSFSASGLWYVTLDACDPTSNLMEVLDSVTLDGVVGGEVRLSVPYLGSANASVSGTIDVQPFGSFEFSTGMQSGGGSFGLGLSKTGGSISFGIPPSGDSNALKTFTGISADVIPGKRYPFSMSGTLSTHLSGFGLTGTAYSIANIYEMEFNLTPHTRITECPEPATCTIFIAGLASIGLFKRRRTLSVQLGA